MKSTTDRAVIGGAANGRGLSRRSVMRTALAGLATVASPAVAMSARIADDAELLGLVEKYIAAEREYLRLCDEAAEIETRAHRETPRSEVLRVRPEDAKLGLPEPYVYPPGPTEYYGHCDLERLADAQWSEVEKVDLPAGVKAIANAVDPVPRHLKEGSFVLNYSKYEPDEVARARADEIVAALNAASAATRAAERKFGLRAAERKRDRACDRACSLAEEIVDVHAHTAAGIMGKARCVAAQCGGEIVIDGSATGVDLALSIAADLIEMGKAVA